MKKSKCHNKNYLRDAAKGRKLLLPYANSFSRYFLYKKGYSLYRGNEQICDYDNPKIYYKHGIPVSWDINLKINPKIITGTFDKNENWKDINDIPTLNSLGYHLIKENGFFKLVKSNVLSIKFNRYIPKGHKIRYETMYGKLMIRGPKSDNKVIYLKDKPKQEIEADLDRLTPMQRYEYYNSGKLPDLKDYNEIYLNEIPIGITDDYKVACLPYMNDAPRYGFVGQTRGGKTISLHAFLTLIRHFWGIPWANLNDWKSECFWWSLAIDKATKRKDNTEKLMKLNLTPRPTPTIYFTPSVDNFSLKEIKMNEKDLPYNNQGIHYLISMGWKNWCDNYNIVFDGFQMADFKNSWSYVNWREIRNLKTREEIFKSLRDFWDNKGLTDKGSKAKVIKNLNYIFDLGILDAVNGLDSEITVKDDMGNEIKMNPFLAAMYAGLCPVLLTSKLRTTKIGKSNLLPPILTSIVQDILKFKEKDDRYFVGKRICIAIDELYMALSQGAGQPIYELSQLGSSSDIMFVWANQIYHSVPPEIRDNTHYVFAFRSGPDSRRELIKKYGAEKSMDKEMTTLKQKECILFHDFDVITYDLETGKREVVETKPLRIQVIPPLSEHK